MLYTANVGDSHALLLTYDQKLKAFYDVQKELGEEIEDP